MNYTWGLSGLFSSTLTFIRVATVYTVQASLGDSENYGYLDPIFTQTVVSADPTFIDHESVTSSGINDRYMQSLSSIDIITISAPFLFLDIYLRTSAQSSIVYNIFTSITSKTSPSVGVLVTDSSTWHPHST